jgi:hypothetical protein
MGFGDWPAGGAGICKNPFMLLMIAKHADVTSHPAEALSRLTAKLSDQYHAIVNPLLSRQAELFRIPEEALHGQSSDRRGRPSYSPDDETIAAEVYAKGSILIAIRQIESSHVRPRFVRGGAMREESISRALAISYAGPVIDAQVVEEFEVCVREVWGDVSLQPIRRRGRAFSEIEAMGQGEPAEKPTALDVDCADTLSDKATRVLAIAIKQSSGLLVSDAPKQIPPKDRVKVDEVIANLIRVGVVSTERVVICRKTSSQVARIPTLEVLSELDQKGIRCSCGRKLSGERAEEALSVTEYGRIMLDGSRWLSILVLRHLMDLGVPIASIRLEQQYEGEEVDCIAEMYGRVVLFELKDKQFNLGNAYSFGAKVGIFRPDYPVIVTTEKVGADARDHFARAPLRTRPRSAYVARADIGDVESMRFIEGLPDLRAGLESVVTDIAIEAFAPHLQLALNFSTGSPAGILRAWTGGNQ